MDQLQRASIQGTALCTSTFRDPSVTTGLCPVFNMLEQNNRHNNIICLIPKTNNN